MSKNDSERKKNEIKQNLTERTFDDSLGTPKKCTIVDVGSWECRITDTEKKILVTAGSVFGTTFASSSLLTTFFETITPQTPLPDYGFTIFKAGMISIFPAIAAAIAVIKTQK